MGRNRVALSEKEELFCKYFAESGAPRESAAKAGYALPEYSALKLLETGRVRDEIARIRKIESEDIRSLAVSGLKKLAFGSVADAVSLIFRAGASKEELEKMDLFCVSEIKMPREGSMEIKFFNRLDALQMLFELAQAEETEATVPFYEALRLGASALAGENREETRVL